MSESGEFILDVDLNELNEPYKLAKWLQMLSKYRTQFLNNNITKTKNDSTVDHDTNCQFLSQFMYQIQYCGKHLKFNFNEDNFKELLGIFHNGNDNYDYNHYMWIWNIIQYVQNRNKIQTICSKKSPKKIEWIDNAWKKFEIMEQYECTHHESKETSKSNKDLKVKFEKKLREINVARIIKNKNDAIHEAKLSKSFQDDKAQIMHKNMLNRD
eukprot:551177_1